MARLSWKKSENDASIKEAVDIVRELGEPLPRIMDDAAFGAMFDRFADAKVVLLGEATHGTSEFYRARAAITRLIEKHGFTIVAVEAVMAEQFDAFVWFDETRAVKPLTHGHGNGMPEIYPFGL